MKLRAARSSYAHPVLLGVLLIELSYGDVSVRRACLEKEECIPSVRAPRSSIRMFRVVVCLLSEARAARGVHGGAFLLSMTWRGVNHAKVRAACAQLPAVAQERLPGGPCHCWT